MRKYVPSCMANYIALEYIWAGFNFSHHIYFLGSCCRSACHCHSVHSWFWQWPFLQSTHTNSWTRISSWPILFCSPLSMAQQEYDRWLAEVEGLFSNSILDMRMQGISCTSLNSWMNYRYTLGFQTEMGKSPSSGPLLHLQFNMVSYLIGMANLDFKFYQTLRKNNSNYLFANSIWDMRM